MTIDPSKVRVVGNWLFCRAMKAQTTRKSGLVLPKDMDKDVVSEGVAEIVAVGPGEFREDLGDYVDHGLRPGDRILYRGFLRYAQQFGDLFGGEKGSSYFLLNAKDALATVNGEGTLGYYDEYVFS